MAQVKASRRERSAGTRRKIIAAAGEEFVARGYHGATVASIAERAGVAPQTVYFVFHTKAELISAVIEFAVLGGDDSSGAPQATPWWAAMVAERRADEALRIFIRGAGPLFERVSPVYEILRAASRTDEEVRQTYDEQEQRRRADFRDVIDLIVAKGALRRGLDVESATDVLSMLVGSSTQQILTAEYGWTHKSWIDWLCDAIPELLLDTPVRRSHSAAAHGTSR